MGRPAKRKRLTGPIHGRIADLRERREMTQDDLARAAGVDKTAVSHWENGIARPEISRLAAIAEALDTTVAKLIAGETAFAALDALLTEARAS